MHPPFARWAKAFAAAWIMALMQVAFNEMDLFVLRDADIGVIQQGRQKGLYIDPTRFFMEQGLGRFVQEAGGFKVQGLLA